MHTKLSFAPSVEDHFPAAHLVQELIDDAPTSIE
jgi:hypothetical protein